MLVTQKRKTFTTELPEHFCQTRASKLQKVTGQESGLSENMKFPFIDLPAELRMKVLVAFYEDPSVSIKVESDFEKDCRLHSLSTNVSHAPLLVCKNFYIDGLRALAATPNKTARCAPTASSYPFKGAPLPIINTPSFDAFLAQAGIPNKFAQYKPKAPSYPIRRTPDPPPPFLNAILKSIHTIEFDQFPEDDLQPLYDQLPNLRRIVAIQFHGAIIHASHILTTSPSIIPVLAGDFDEAFTSEAQLEITEKLASLPHQIPPSLTSQFTRLIPSNRWRIEMQDLKLPGTLLNLHISYAAGKCTILKKSFAKIGNETEPLPTGPTEVEKGGTSHPEAAEPTIEPRYRGVDYEDVYVIPPYDGWCGNGGESWWDGLFK